MKIYNFNLTIQYWLAELGQYNYDQLCLKQNPKEWSLGQLYLHIIEATNYFFDQIEVCLLTNDNSEMEMHKEAKVIFQQGAFPNTKIVGPQLNDEIKNDVSKE